MNGKTGWLVAIGGIPLAVLLGWAFSAGTMRADVDWCRSAIALAAETNQRQEARLVRLETMFERTALDISEIKQMLKQRP